MIRLPAFTDHKDRSRCQSPLLWKVSGAPPHTRLGASPLAENNPHIHTPVITKKGYECQCCCMLSYIASHAFASMLHLVSMLLDTLISTSFNYSVKYFYSCHLFRVIYFICSQLLQVCTDTGMDRSITTYI